MAADSQNGTPSRSFMLGHLGLACGKQPRALPCAWEAIQAGGPRLCASDPNTLYSLFSY